MAEKTLKIPYALKDGEPIHVDDVVSGLACNCYCPICKGSLIARKGEIKVYHFAHSSETNCSGESILHYWGKTFLAKRISAAIEQKKELPFEWQCDLCPDLHQGNLVKKANEVFIERDFGNCRPDIAIMNALGESNNFLEIVVSHKPEPIVEEFTSCNKIGLIEFHLKSLEDLDRLKNSEILSATKVRPCKRPKCKTCGEIMKREVLYLFVVPCWRCQKPMKMAQLSIDEQPIPLRLISEAGITEAKKFGVILENNFSNTMKEWYLSNSCSNCKTFVGEFYRHQYYDYIVEDKAHFIQYVCFKCEDKFKDYREPEEPELVEMSIEMNVIEKPKPIENLNLKTIAPILNTSIESVENINHKINYNKKLNIPTSLIILVTTSVILSIWTIVKSLVFK